MQIDFPSCRFVTFLFSTTDSLKPLLLPWKQVVSMCYFFLFPPVENDFESHNMPSCRVDAKSQSREKKGHNRKERCLSVVINKVFMFYCPCLLLSNSV